jgi:hypothetical protein
VRPSTVRFADAQDDAALVFGGVGLSLFVILSGAQRQSKDAKTPAR